MNTRRFFILNLILMFSIPFSRAQPSPGALDLTFADRGISRVGFSGGEQFGFAAVTQGDGKLLLAGTYGGSFDEFEIVRFDTNNVLDASFGAGGAVFTSFGPVATFAFGASALAVAIQADGKIVAGGWADRTGTYGDFALARYNPNGSLDDSFGSGGKVITDLGASARIAAIRIQADGKIMAAGSAGTNFALARYNTNGVLDGSFGSGGVVTTDVGGGFGEYGANALLLLGNGGCIATGFGLNGSDFATIRYTSTGALDTTFGGTGKVFTPIPGYVLNYATAIGYQLGNFTVQNPDKVIVVGRCFNSSLDTVYAIVRYNLDGSLDTTFAGTGILKDRFVSTDPYGSATGVFVQGQLTQPRKITVSGIGGSSTATYFGLARYTASGTLDTSFGAGTGKATLSFGPQHDDVAYAMTLQSGKIVLAGESARNSSSPYNDVFAAARFNSDGSLDTTFGNNGVVTADVCGSSVAEAVASQTDGKVVVAGYAYSIADVFALTRYNPDGSLDSSFGANGRVSTQVGTSNAVANAVAIQSDGKIVAAGWAGQAFNNRSFALARYTTSGALDSAFGGSGRVITPVGGQNDVINAVTLQPDGRIVVAGSSLDFPRSDFAVARYLSNGALDGSFDGTGKATVNVAGSDCFARGLQVQSDGKILTAGYTYGAASTNFALVRFNPDGSVDNSFGSFGRVSTSFGAGSIAYGYALALQQDGKAVVAGQLTSGGIGYFAVARYGLNGTLDSTFGIGGKVTTQIGLTFDSGVAAAVMPNGKIVIAGTSYQGGFAKYAAARFNADGSLDITYGFGGKVVIDFEDGYDSATALALDQIGRAVIVGGANGLFGVARLTSEPFLKITSINPLSGGEMMLRGLGVADGTHTLLASPDLAPATFGPLHSVTADAGGFWQYLDAGATGSSKRFYRLSYP